MSETDLANLMADTEAQLDAAQQAVGTGAFVDLADLLPRIDALCALAIAQRRKAAAAPLARLLLKLDTLQAALRAQIRHLGAEARPDPKRAAETYRAASGPGSPADERK